MVAFEMRHVTPEGGYSFFDAFHLSPNSSLIPIGLERLAPEMVSVMERTDRGVLFTLERGLRDLCVIMASGKMLISITKARVQLFGQVSRNFIANIENMLTEVL